MSVSNRKAKAFRKSVNNSSRKDRVHFYEWMNGRKLNRTIAGRKKLKEAAMAVKKLTMRDAKDALFRHVEDERKAPEDRENPFSFGIVE